jgi:hypothetical protein
VSRDLSRGDAPEDPYEVPPFWTPEHVAHRLIHAFDVLMATTGRIAPSSYGGGWPTALREFSDLIDEQSMNAAREAYAENLRRPTAEEISMSDEALAWPLQYAAHEPMACDAVLLWSMCKAGGFSIARLLRERTVKAKTMAERMAAAEWERVRKPIERARKQVIVDAGKWRDAQALEGGLNAMGEADKAQAWADLTAQMMATIRTGHEALVIPMKPTVLPWQAMPEKILSRSSLDRYLPAGLAYLAEQLHRAQVLVR